LSYSKVRAIARVATPASEDDLVDIALHAPAAHVERLARGLRTSDQHEPTQNAEDASRRCRTQWRWDEDTGELVFWGRLPAQDGAALLAAATRAEHEQTGTLASDTSSVGPDTGGSAEHPDLTGPPPIDLGPALVAMATITCATIAAPVHAVSAEILIHHTPHGAHLDDGPPLTSAAAQEMACGARERSVIIDEWRILHYGRSRRAPRRRNYAPCTCLTGRWPNPRLRSHPVSTRPPRATLATRRDQRPDQPRWKSASQEVRTIINLVKTTMMRNDETAGTTQSRARTAVQNIG